MRELKLIVADPPPDIQKTILRIQRDAAMLKSFMTKAQARSAFVILEKARDDLSAVVDRAEIYRVEIE